MFPALAILIGNAITNLWRQGHQNLSPLYIYATSSIFLCFAGGSVVYFFPELLNEKVGLLNYIHTLVGVFFISGLTVLWYLRRFRIKISDCAFDDLVFESVAVLTTSTFRALWIKVLRLRPSQIAISIIGFSSIVILFTLIYAAPYMQRPSIKPLVEIINQNRKPGDKVVSFMAYYQDLPVYTEQTVMVVEAKGELEFGTTVEDTTSWMIKEEQFMNLWKEQKMWIIGRKTELEHLLNRHPNLSYSIIAEDQGNVLFTQK